MKTALFPSLLIATLLGAPPSSFACAEETFEQCSGRYGTHLNTSADGYASVFESDGFRVFAGFLNGRAVEISYRKLPSSPNHPGPLPQMSVGEIHSLLRKNSGGAPWENSHPDLYTVNYTCPEKNLTATYSTLTGQLFITSGNTPRRLAAMIPDLDKPRPSVPPAQPEETRQN